MLVAFFIVEMMGHRRYGARVGEASVAGETMLKCEVCAPAGDGFLTVQFIRPESIYALTECTEEQARKANSSAYSLSNAVPGLALPSGTIEVAPARDEGDEDGDEEDEDEWHPESPLSADDLGDFVKDHLVCVRVEIERANVSEEIRKQYLEPLDALETIAREQAEDPFELTDDSDDLNKERGKDIPF